MEFVIQVLQILILVSVLEGKLFKSLFHGHIKKKSEGSGSSSSSEELQCDRPYYRSHDGYCNNLEYPDWGTPNIPYVRMFPNYSYEDGLCEMADLPNPRKISLQGFVSLDGTEDPRWTLNTIIWGQVVAHDMGLTAGVPQTGEQEIIDPCCVGGKTVGKSTAEHCASIVIPEDDPYNVPEGNQCMSFVRTKSTCDKKSEKPAEQINGINSYLDGSLIYGNSEEEAKLLRSFINGKLLYQTRHGRMYPPPSRTAKCFPYLKVKEPLCLQTGDRRANQNPYIILAQTILLRYHNNIAEKLCTVINKHWDDETCYQEARRIAIATMQHITYYEFLTFILGKIDMITRKLITAVPSTFHSVYDKDVDASCINEHAAAAFRVFHSGIQGHIKLMTQDRQEFGTIKLGDRYDDASLLLENNTELGLATGCSTQRQWELDRYHDAEVNQALFKHNDKLGSDLFASDVLRGRDHGLASYAVALKECGLGDPQSFDDFKKHMSKENVELLKKLYDSHEKVELRVGGQLEKVVEYGLTGPTFKCIMLEQFDRTKRGDYYWYENEEQDLPFTKEQLISIKKGATISSLMCNQVDGMKRIQKLGFEVENILYNPMVACKDIPRINLTLWKEENENEE